MQDWGNYLSFLSINKLILDIVVQLYIVDIMKHYHTFFQTLLCNRLQSIEKQSLHYSMHHALEELSS